MLGFDRSMYLNAHNEVAHDFNPITIINSTTTMLMMSFVNQEQEGSIFRQLPTLKFDVMISAKTPTYATLRKRYCSTQHSRQIHEIIVSITPAPRDRTTSNSSAKSFADQKINNMNEEMDKTKCWRSNNTLWLTNSYIVLSSERFPDHGLSIDQGYVLTQTLPISHVYRKSHCIPNTILIDYNDKVFILRLFPPIPGSTSVKSSLHGPRPRPSTFSFTYLSSSQKTAGGIESTSTSI